MSPTPAFGVVQSAVLVLFFATATAAYWFNLHIFRQGRPFRLVPMSLMAGRPAPHAHTAVKVRSSPRVVGSSVHGPAR